MEYADSHTTYTLFKYYDPRQDRTFLSLVPQAEVEGDLETFYETIKLTIMFIMTGLLLLLVMSVYFSYKPIYNLSRKIGRIGETEDDAKGFKNRDANEIDLIEQAFDRLGSVNAQMQETISEQRVQLMDLLLSKLLAGERVEDTDIKWMSRFLNEDRYCAFTVHGLVLDNVKRELLIKDIYKKHRSRVALIDMPYEKHSVFILALSQHTDRDSLIQDIEQHLKSIVTGEIKIGIGNLVNNIKEIRTSYLNSLSVLETDGKVEYYDDLLKNLSSIEKYPAQEVLSFLNNMKSGNKEGALEDLKKIEDHISENVLSILVERYISYIILDSYIKTVNKMNIPDDRENINSILEFNRFSELREILIPRINKVCDWAARVKEKEKNKLNESIISYVDKHFTDYNLSLLQMADHFNLSIYALSRLFKEIVGVGFKEYVTGKRIELAKHLLITTEKKVGDIAVEVGFGSSSNFIRAFKANCGVSPAKYKA